MQRIEYTQKPLRVPDRTNTVRRRLEMQRRIVLASIVTAIALILTSAIVTGVRQASVAAPVTQVPNNILVIETK